MNAVSPIYYLHTFGFKVTIILAWKKKSSSIVKSRIQAKHMNVQGCAISSTKSSERLLLSYFFVQGTN